MVRKTYRGKTWVLERLLFTSLMLHILLQNTKAATTNPNRDEQKRKAQSASVQNYNTLNINEEENGQGKEPHEIKNNTDIEKPKEDKKQSPDNKENSSQVIQEHKSSSAKQNENTSTTSESPSTTAVNKTETAKIVDAKYLCNSSKVCLSYNNSACVQDPRDSLYRCLCGNRMVPKNNTCKNISRYVKFPCSHNNQCIDNAECLLGRTKDLINDIAHSVNASTTSICLCKTGFDPNENNSQCLDPLGRLKVEQYVEFMNLKRAIQTLKDEQKAVDMRLKILENSGVNITPAIASTFFIALSALAIH